MSQYPSPYQPPTPPPTMGYDPYNPGPLQPARRASILLYILGALGMLSAVCCIGTGAMLPRMLAEKPEMFRELQQMPGVTPELIRTVLLVFGGISALSGLGMLILAPFVRQGSKGAIITAMIISIGAILFLIAQILGVFLHPSAQGATGGCMMAVPLALFISLVVCLIQALSASGQVEAMRNQYAQQYWQSAYQQQMYRQGGAIPPHAGFQPPPQPPQPPPQPPRGPDGPSSQG